MKIVLSLCLLVGASALAQDAGAFDADERRYQRPVLSPPLDEPAQVFR